MALLEAGLRASVPAVTFPRYSVEPSSRRCSVRPVPAIADVMRRSVVPPTSSRTAARYSAGVMPLSGSMFEGEPSSIQPSVSGSMP